MHEEWWTRIAHAALNASRDGEDMKAATVVRELLDYVEGAEMVRVLAYWADLALVEPRITLDPESSVMLSFRCTVHDALDECEVPRQIHWAGSFLAARLRDDIAAQTDLITALAGMGQAEGILTTYGLLKCCGLMLRNGG